MAVSEESAKQWLTQLTEEIELLKNVEVSEVLGLIQSEIAEGRPIVRKVRVVESAGQDRIAGTPRSGSATSADLVGSKPYSAVEALDLTTEALALAFIAPIQMAAQLLNTVVRLSGNKKEDCNLYFPGRSGEGDRNLVKINSTLVDQARDSLHPLAMNLTKLGDELGLHKRHISFESETSADGN